jgi:hypothetical protein
MALALLYVILLAFLTLDSLFKNVLYSDAKNYIFTVIKYISSRNPYVKGAGIAQSV